MSTLNHIKSLGSENGVGGPLTSRSLHNELVKSHALATGLGDSGAGGLGEAEAATLSLGMSRTLMSSVTVPTTTAVRSALLPRCLISLESERGGRLVLEEMSLLRTVLVKVESVLRDRNLNNYTQNMVSTPKPLGIFNLPSQEGRGKGSCS